MQFRVANFFKQRKQHNSKPKIYANKIWVFWKFNHLWNYASFSIGHFYTEGKIVLGFEQRNGKIDGPENWKWIGGKINLYRKIPEESAAIWEIPASSSNTRNGNFWESQKYFQQCLQNCKPWFSTDDCLHKFEKCPRFLKPFCYHLHNYGSRVWDRLDNKTFFITTEFGRCYQICKINKINLHRFPTLSLSIVDASPSLNKEKPFSRKTISGLMVVDIAFYWKFSLAFKLKTAKIPDQYKTKSRYRIQINPRLTVNAACYTM